MPKSIFYSICIFIKIILRRRFFENILGIKEGIEEIKKKSDKCTFCTKCKLIWYMASAIKLEDPYKIIEINDLLVADGIDYASSVEMGAYVMEAAAWIGKNELKTSTSADKGSSELIRKWKLGQLTTNDLNAIRSATTSLRWPFEVIMGSLLELQGYNDAAVQHYRRAMKIMPRWLPESKVVYEKINVLNGL